MKTKWIIFLAVLLPQIAFCAPDVDIDALLRSDNQDLLKMAVKDGLCMMESSYILQDKESGQRFGLDGNPYFNKKSYLAVRVDGGLVVWKDALSPWNKDELVQSYLEQYVPEMYRITTQIPGDTSLCVIDTATYGDTLKISDNYRLLRQSSNGFDIDVSAGKKEGWIIYLSGNDNPQIKCIRKNILIKDSTAVLDIEVPQLLSSSWGGIYVVPSAEGVGRITCKLCGIIMPVQNSRVLSLQPLSGLLNKNGLSKPAKETPKKHQLTPKHSHKKK